MSILQPGIESIPSVGRSAARNLSCPVKENDSILDKFCILAQKGGGSDIFKHCTEKAPFWPIHSFPHTSNLSLLTLDLHWSQNLKMSLCRPHWITWASDFKKSKLKYKWKTYYAARLGLSYINSSK